MGCVVKTTRSGKLAFRMFWAGFPGGRGWETTDLPDTPENRKLVQAQAVLIAREIKNGSFDYLKWFPHGNKAHLFTAPVKIDTVREYFRTWILDKTPPIERKSLERDYRQHMNTYILPRFGDKRLEAINITDLKEFRLYLVQDLELAIKTAKNIISSTFQAFFRDAEAEGLVTESPFADLPNRWWPTIDSDDPDPFDEEERDKILEYYRKKGLYAYRYLYFQFWTGWRPSEATALRWGKVDIARARAEVVRSRNLGAESTPKTKGSRRVVDLLPNVVAMLREMKPLHVTAEDYVFLNSKGRPMRLDNIRIKTWYNTLRVTGIRPRKPSSTRHTFISVMLSHGENPKKLAERVGNSQDTIEKHYGKYIRYNDDAGLRAIEASKLKSATAGETKVDLVAPKRRQPARISRESVWWSQRDSNPCYRRERPVS